MRPMDNTATNATLAQIADRILGAQRIAICGHVSPDGDCIGSQLALACGLRQAGKEAICLLAADEPIEYGLRFLPGAADFVPAEHFKGSIDLFVTVDVPSAARLGSFAADLHAKAPATVTIDHHISESPLSQMNFVDADAPSCSLLIWHLLEAMDINRDAAMATCCFTGLMTDTGRFSFQNATADAFDVAASMVRAGANPGYIAMKVFQNRSRASLRLEQIALAHAQYFHDGAFVVSVLSEADFKEAGAVRADAEPLIDVLRSVRGVRVACMLREKGSAVRGSLRAKDETDVGVIARSLGGGGHRAAAGFTFNGSLGAARARIETEFSRLASRETEGE